MNVERRLNRVRWGWQEFNRLSLKVEELESLAQKITPTLSDMPKGNSPHPKDDTWATLIDYRTMCEEVIRQYLKDCKDLEEEMECIRSERIRTCMKLYYIDRYSQCRIADIMNYTERAIRSFLSKGRKIYYETYKDQEGSDD